MIKIETLGMYDVAKVNPVLTSTSDTANYSFITNDDDLYLVANTLTGDDYGKEDVVIPAGEYLNGFLVKAWDAQKLVIDGKHIDAGDGNTINDISVDDILVVASSGGGLEVADSEPDSGIYFKVTDVGIRLTEQAVKAKVVVAVGTAAEDEDDSPEGENGSPEAI